MLIRKFRKPFAMYHVPSISCRDTRAASSHDDTSTPAVGLPRPRHTHFVIFTLLVPGRTSSSRIFLSFV